MSASLELQISQSTDLPELYAYTLKLEILNAIDMPAELFIFRRGASPAPVAGATPTDQFSCIADPVDLQEIPTDVPDLEAEIPYYRKSSVELAFRSMDDLDDTVTDIKADISGLVTTLNSMTALTITETVEYP